MPKREVEYFVKLTDTQGKTRNGTKWEVGKTVAVNEEGNTLCTSQVLHGYRTPYHAVLFSPIHCEGYTRAFVVQSATQVADDGLKIGCKRMKVIREIKLPKISTKKRVELTIKVALTVYKEPKFVRWAEAWLSGKDRTWAASVAASAAASTSAAAVAAARAAEAAAVARAAVAAVWVAEAAEAAAAGAAAAVAAAATLNLTIEPIILELFPNAYDFSREV